jgi:hypothetical protein
MTVEETESIERLEETLKNFGFTQIELEQIKEGKAFGKIMSEGATRILKERIRQVMVEGWSAERDDQHIHGDLAVYAAGLAVYDTDALIDDPDSRIEYTEAGIEDQWGLIAKHQNDPERMLEIAGALIAAELDRVIRKGS